MPYRKVFRVMAPNRRRALVGYCGSGAFIAAHLHWLRGGERPAFTHARFEWQVLMVDDSFRVWSRCDDADYWDPRTLPRWAVGSGADLAIGAMACGKTAREAVRIACRYDFKSGLGVDVVKF